MISFRIIALGSFFGALAALEVAHGMWRLKSLREGREAEILAAADRGQSDLVQTVLSRLSMGREHASYLARLPSLLQLQGERSEESRRRAERDVLVHLRTFGDADRVRALDEHGSEILRCERIGSGVGSLPAMLLAPEPEPAVEALISGLPAAAVRESEIVGDPDRAEMPPDKRQVLHFATRIAGGGALVLTVYAAPIVQAVTSYAPIEGARTLLVDPAGAPIPDAAAVDGPMPAEEYERAWHEIEAGSVIAGGEEGWLVARPIGLGRPTRVVTILPRAAIRRALQPLRSEAIQIVGSMTGVTLAIAAGAVFFLRMSLRALRVREAERYMAWIRRENAKWRALTECAADMILIVDPRDETIRERNREAGQFLGERPLEQCLPPAEYAELRAALEAAVSALNTPVSMPDLHLRDVQGRECVFDPRLVGIDLDGDRVVEIALRDVTRERSMERQLSISERLSSIGMLTAGVAHEINNPLEGIGNYLALLSRDEVPAEKRMRYVESVRLGFDRIRDLVRDLLSFARPDVGQGVADLSQVVTRVGKLVGFSKPFAGIEILREGLDEPMLVAADQGRVEQVLLNLMLNAAAAMGGRGRIHVSARRLDSSTAGASMVELVVDDEGPGIPEADLSRIFDPFFTTTQGTGLGLSISYGIVRAHGGRIHASNRSQGGARFTIELPAGHSARVVQ